MTKLTSQINNVASSATATFVELLRESVIIQGILTLSVLGVWLYMIASTGSAPEILTGVVGTMIGFYFGGKFTQAMARVKEQNPPC